MWRFKKELNVRSRRRGGEKQKRRIVGRGLPVAEEDIEIDKVLRSELAEVRPDQGEKSSGSAQASAAAARGDGTSAAAAAAPSGIQDKEEQRWLTWRLRRPKATRVVTETAELMLDEEVEARKILLQIGGVSVRQAYSLTEPVLVELYSPPRLTEFARRSGWGDGLALDLTTCDENGEEWDFTKKSCRKRAERH